MRALRNNGKAAAFALLLSGVPLVAGASDEIEVLLRSGRVPADMIRNHGYSDFTDPLGRFLDLLAAGDFAGAKSIQSEACATWLATRQASALTGKFQVWDTEINLDTLCSR